MYPASTIFLNKSCNRSNRVTIFSNKEYIFWLVLGAEVAKSVNADLLILLSDIDGLYTADPHKDPNAKLISCVTKLDDSIYALAGGKGSAFGTGGMVTKLNAAKICMDCGCDMIITNGANTQNIYDAIAGDAIGTRFTVK